MAPPSPANDTDQSRSPAFTLRCRAPSRWAWQTLSPMAARTEARRPSLGLFLTDFPRGAADFGLFLAAAPLLRRRAPRGDGHPVLVLPGLMAADSSTRPLRRYL